MRKRRTERGRRKSWRRKWCGSGIYGGVSENCRGWKRGEDRVRRRWKIPKEGFVDGGLRLQLHDRFAEIRDRFLQNFYLYEERTRERERERERKKERKTD